MIKSVASGQLVHSSEYPRMMYAESPGVIVMFTDNGEGTLVFKFSTSFSKDDVGHYSDAWDMTAFKPWRGTVTLTQD